MCTGQKPAGLSFPSWKCASGLALSQGLRTNRTPHSPLTWPQPGTISSLGKEVSLSALLLAKHGIHAQKPPRVQACGNAATECVGVWHLPLALPVAEKRACWSPPEEGRSTDGQEETKRVCQPRSECTGAGGLWIPPARCPQPCLGVVSLRAV